jgi:hypothetical protein
MNKAAPGEGRGLRSGYGKDAIRRTIKATKCDTVPRGTDKHCAIVPPNGPGRLEATGTRLFLHRPVRSARNDTAGLAPLNLKSGRSDQGVQAT